jgi:hypothetical protein
MIIRWLYDHEMTVRWSYDDNNKMTLKGAYSYH